MEEKHEKKCKEISVKTFAHMFSQAGGSSRRYCFILGSGASKEGNIRTGVDMARIWVKELNERYSPDDLERLKNELQVKDITPNGENYFGIYDLRFYPDYEEGNAYFEHELERGKPSLGHHVLANILAGEKHNLVITTNFDSLIEDALFIYTNKHPLVAGHESLAKFINLNIKRPIVAKIHRSLYFEPRNSKKQTDDLAKEWKETLKNAFMVYTPIVIGYSGGDQSLMKFLQDENTKMNGLYWCYWNKEEPSDAIKELVCSKGGCLVSIEGFDQMMFMIGKKMGLKNPADEMQKVTDDRINRYNMQCEIFEKRIYEAEKETQTRKEIQETVKEIDTSLKTELEEAKKKLEEERTAKNYFSVAWIYQRTKEYTKAIESYTKAIEIDSKYIAAYNNRGNCYQDKKEYDKAIMDYTKAIELDSEYVYAYNNRGNSYYNKGEYDKAITDYTKAIELDSEYRHAYNGRGMSYDSKKEYDKAIVDYIKAIELDAEYVNAYNNRGVTYKHMGEYNKAVTDYSKALELNPKYARAYRNRAVVYEKLGEIEKAAQDRETAQRLETEAKS